MLFYHLFACFEYNLTQCCKCGLFDFGYCERLKTTIFQMSLKGIFFQESKKNLYISNIMKDLEHSEGDLALNK